MTDMEKISAALEGALRLIPELVAEIERMRALANDAAESATQHQTELLRLRTELANVNNEFGSQTADWPDAWRRVAELKQCSNDRWRETERLRAALNHIIDRLQMDIDDGGRPDQWSMEDLVRTARKALEVMRDK